jgi:sulfite exporter TauE/SafE
MIPLLDPLEQLTYGQIHVIELGLAIGFLAATFYRNERVLSYAILGVSTGLIVLHRFLQELPEVVSITSRINSRPVLFLVPMGVAYLAGVLVRLKLRTRSSAPTQDGVVDQDPDESS